MGLSWSPGLRSGAPQREQGVGGVRVEEQASASSHPEDQNLWPVFSCLRCIPASVIARPPSDSVSLFEDAPTPTVCKELAQFTSPQGRGFRWAHIIGNAPSCLFLRIPGVLAGVSGCLLVLVCISLSSDDLGIFSRADGPFVCGL